MFIIHIASSGEHLLFPESTLGEVMQDLRSRGEAVCR